MNTSWPEYQLAAMNEALGIAALLLPARPVLAAVSSTLLLPARPALAAVSSTVLRRLGP